MTDLDRGDAPRPASASPSDPAVPPADPAGQGTAAGPPVWSAGTRPALSSTESTPPLSSTESTRVSSAGTAPTSGPAPIAAPAAGAAAVATAPVGRSGGVRWGIALAVVAIMVGLVAAAAFLLTGQNQPEALAFVPSRSIVVVEVRPDLPGDQRQALGTVLGHFPGFADQSNLGAKIDEALDQLVQRVTDGDRRYVGDLKPYLAGPLYVAIPGAQGTTAADPTERALVVLTTDGSSGLGCERLDPSTPTTAQRHRDVEMRVGPGERQVACAMTGRFVLLGDVASVRTAIDTKADATGIATSASYKAAANALPGDHLAWAYVDPKGAFALAATGPSPSLLPLPSALPVDQLPDWAAMELRATSGGPVLESVMPDPRRSAGSGASPASSRTPRPDAVSAIAPRLPAGTIAVVELHDVGGQVISLLDQLRHAPGGSDVTAQLDAMLGLVGGPGGLLGSLDQAAVAVTLDGGKVNAGVVIQTSDGSGASGFEQLGTLLTLAGVPGLTSETYKGARLLKLPLDSILGLAGGLVPGGLPGGGSPLPPEAEDQVLVLAAHEGVLLAGLGDTFVKSVLDTPSGASLADQSRYRAVMDAAGSTNSGQVYVDVQGVIAAVVPLLSATEAATFERDVRPYLQPIAAVGSGWTNGDGLIRSRMIVSIP